MSEGTEFQRDVLEDRSWIDRWGFLLFAFGGGAAILVAKSVGLTAIPVAVFAATAMVAYASIVQASGTGKLRADQAGDNCYYLGLIYTLISLAYAIFFFDPATTATTVVQGFGIALATTIMGLVLRVFFNQTRVDLVQTEDTARIELADAAGRLKAELQAITVSMSDYGRETRQALEELRGQVVEALGAVQGDAGKSMSETAATASEAIRSVAKSATDALSTMSTAATATVTQQANEAVTRSRRLSTATDKVVTGIEKHSEAMLGIERSTTAIGESLITLENAAVSTQKNLGELSARAEELAGTQTSLVHAGGDLRQAVADMAAQVKSFDETASRFDTNVNVRLEEVKGVPANTAKRTAEAFAKAAEAMEEQFVTIARAQEKFIEDLSRRAEASAAMLDRHNAALEQDLGRSRENVGKVHTALVEMTGSLVNRVQATDA
ncbi:hypothetical protein [Novosphingobium mangrovi (ex Hu et al. 2023)]|uniref:Methyl-accepting transducer domain-containing protein n=1 Tax=Novosphingobium mangrovi (ex Hu et al. 2023) TaxID=2930094 RepID=A0ABT0A8Z6_9SPHN|nr:hypothetical protein [Novosphingobium mangrovi (ex Hu et al. 2023)]MCJ1959652.1 hypothetical protein [Novosphingobium mangrovi (ex Hu et al. 2023)]